MVVYFAHSAGTDGPSEEIRVSCLWRDPEVPGTVLVPGWPSVFPKCFKYVKGFTVLLTPDQGLMKGANGVVIVNSYKMETLPKRRLHFLFDLLGDGFYAAFPDALAWRVFSPRVLTLICLGLASAFLASLISSTPLL
jgi:hypothetical protein